MPHPSVECSLLGRRWREPWLFENGCLLSLVRKRFFTRIIDIKKMPSSIYNELYEEILSWTQVELYFV